MDNNNTKVNTTVNTTVNITVNKIVNLYNKYGSFNYIGENITQIDHAIQCAEHAIHDIRLNKYTLYEKQCVIVAALLHDIGHLVGYEETTNKNTITHMIDADADNVGADADNAGADADNAGADADADNAGADADNDYTHTNKKQKKQSLGIMNHELIGSNYLQKCGLPLIVCELVNSHVQSKRYLSTISKKYFDKLSNASKKTLVIQGGLMTPPELQIFKSSPLAQLKILLREYDDTGKKTYGNDTGTLNKKTIENYKQYIEDILNLL